jgi:hypothetical protein
VVLQVRIDKFTIEADPQQLPGGTRYYLVKGEAVERFAQVGNNVAVCNNVVSRLYELYQDHQYGILRMRCNHPFRCRPMCCLVCPCYNVAAQSLIECSADALR